MEKKVLFNVLDAIRKGNANLLSQGIAPDKEYLTALETIGFIKVGWGIELTEFGNWQFRVLQNDLIKW